MRATLTGAVRNPSCRIIGLLGQEAALPNMPTIPLVSVCGEYCARRTGPLDPSQNLSETGAMF